MKLVDHAMVPCSPLLLAYIAEQQLLQLAGLLVRFFCRSIFPALKF